MDSGPALQPQPPKTHRAPRVRLTTRVESRSNKKISLGRTRNISAGGLLVCSRDTFEPGTEVRVRFNLPFGHRIEAQGVVVYARPGVHMGIRFSQLEEKDRQAIQEFIQDIRR